MDPWNIDWSDEVISDPLSLAEDPAIITIAGEVEEPSEEQMVEPLEEQMSIRERHPEPAGTRYKLLKEVGRKPKNPALPRSDQLLDCINGYKYLNHKTNADGSISWRCTHTEGGFLSGLCKAEFLCWNRWLYLSEKPSRSLPWRPRHQRDLYFSDIEIGKFTFDIYEMHYR